MKHPVKNHFKTLEELTCFLKQCTYVPDMEQYDKPDYWDLPEHFEEVQKGDCEDFALYTWRQLVEMGYSARFVVGLYSGGGHAWVNATIDGKEYILEPTCGTVKKLPRWNTLKHSPEVSVAWEDGHCKYYRHEEKVEWYPSIREALPYLAEAALFYFLLLPKLPKALLRRLWRLMMKPVRQEKVGNE